MAGNNNLGCKRLTNAFGYSVQGLKAAYQHEEAIVDRFGSDHHKLSGRAKDMGSAAVLVMSITAAMTWLLIFLC